MSASTEFPVPGHARTHHRPDPPGRLEKITLAHVAILVLFAAWAFGGNTAWAQVALAGWGSLGFLITLAALRDRTAREAGYHRPLRWLWPLAGFNLLVLVSALNPSYRAVADGGRWLYVEGSGWPGLPSSARPALTLLALWFFDAVYVSCFNLALVVRSRRALRALLLIVAGNALVLAVFGTVQKLLGADGLYFGLRKFPQVHFFATFIYHNHWGAFTVLMCAILLGLIAHYARAGTGRDPWHSPVFAALVGLLFLAATVPLSTSRSCTVLVVLLLGGGFGHWVIRQLRQGRRHGTPVGWKLGGAFLGVGLAAGLIFELARPQILTRLAATESQLADMRARGSVGSRAILYRDTWHLALEKPGFGWGMASYPTVFFHRNTQQFSHADGLPMYFHDAHSDWLQSLAEVGFAGTALLGLCALVPLYHRRRTLGRSPLAAYLLAGDGLLVLYAWLEFPFGNRAVVAAFWLCFFCAVHYARLETSAERAA